MMVTRVMAFDDACHFRVPLVLATLGSVWTEDGSPTIRRERHPRGDTSRRLLPGTL